jgi:hypothetical protein
MKRVALWSAVLILPLLMGAAAFALHHAGNSASQAALADCCLDPNCPPGCSEKCPPDCLLTATAKACCPDSECCPDSACCTNDCPPCPWCP